MILFSADNRPPMLDKDLYDSWKSQMELYMRNREHGRMILESVEHCPLIWPTVEENGVIRTKKYAKLSAAEKIQADCHEIYQYHSSGFPSTNNQLRISSNIRNQATIQDGRVTVQQVQGRQRQNYSGTTTRDKLRQSFLTMMLSRLRIPILMILTIVLWYLDSGCSKHMTGNCSQLMNFVSKFLGTVRFKNDQIARIMGYGDYQLGNIVISRVYYVEGLGHNLFSVGQFCNADLEVAFRKNICFIHDLEGVDLISGSHDINLYTISLDDMLKSSSICLLSKASKIKSWLWHR
uniref:Integrase, catalytic region, zinc finger, CCHC-type, peptidase aspartic, catalytic n=1 Tax=Tanacetum cinerariifolium TaxID=118510 RepID=A0A699HL88_TANCI|nr:integrase, catalytic region, zinc finger, CCHC-type, peptidase aspartic, catalytic [Tanacetum cinerariifolium]